MNTRQTRGSGSKVLRLIACTGASAALLAWPIHHAWAAPVAIAFLVPWLLVIEPLGWLPVIGLGALLGILYGVLISLWIPAALVSLGSSDLESLAGLVAVPAWAGPPVFVLAGLATRLSVAWPPAARSAVFGAAVFGAETLISHTWWGVPWGLLGYSQLGVLGVAQLAVVGGVPLVSALLAASNVSVADAIRRRHGAAPLAASFLAGWAMLALLGVPLAEGVRPAAVGEPTDLLLVQPDLPEGERWARSLQPLNLHRVREFSESALAEQEPGIDAVVLPENLLTAAVDASPELGAAVTEWVTALGVPVLSGMVVAAEDPRTGLYRSAVVWIDPRHGFIDRLDKERAIPFFESSRQFAGAQLLAALLGRAATGPRVEEARGESALSGPVSVVAVLCYEALFPGIVARRRVPESLAIVNLADDSWVPGETATRQLTDRVRFRAIEQRLWLVRAAHGGLSAVIDPFGRVVDTLPLDAYAARRVSLRREVPPTLAERAALFGLPLGAFLVVGWAWRRVEGWRRWRPRGEKR